MNAREKQPATADPLCLDFDAPTSAGEIMDAEPAAAPAPLVTRQTATMATRGPATPATLVDLAMDQGADLERLERLMGLKRDWERDEARKAFNQAMAAFKANPPVLTKNRTVDFTTAKGRTHYNHADLAEVANKIGAALSPHGLSFRWTPEQKNGRIFVTCTLHHADGHSESVTMDGPADESGNKNSIQAAGSTVTYLQRYTLLAITGMAVSGEDDDGRGATPKAQNADAMAADTLAVLEGSIEHATTLEALQAAWGTAYNLTKKDQAARTSLSASYNARKAELTGGAK